MQQLSLIDTFFFVLLGYVITHSFISLETVTSYLLCARHWAGCQHPLSKGSWPNSTHPLHTTLRMGFVL